MELIYIKADHKYERTEDIQDSKFIAEPNEGKFLKIDQNFRNDCGRNGEKSLTFFQSGT